MNLKPDLNQVVNPGSPTHACWDGGGDLLHHFTGDEDLGAGGGSGHGAGVAGLTEYAMMGHPPQSPMPLLPPIEGLHFDEAAHRYAWQGQWLPWSSTGIVSDLTPHARKRIDETKHVWEPRGLAVHACLEHHLLGEAALDPGDYREWVEPLLDCWLFQGCEPLGVEYRLVDPRKRVAGSCDFILRTAKGTIVLGDLKTVSSEPAAHSRKTADAQLGSYISMMALHHPYLVINRCVTVVSGPGVTLVKPSEPDACVAAWEEAWVRHQVAQDLLGF